MKRTIFFIILIIISLSTFAQDKVIIDKDVHYMAIDPQGNLYLVDDNTLYKYNLKGEMLASYTNKMLGQIYSIDVDNPFKIMLFYHDEGKILFLNGQLAPIGDELDLFSKGLITIDLVTHSSNNNLYLYDISKTEMIITDLHLNIKERMNYNLQLFMPSEIYDQGEKMIVMHDPFHGVYFFDQFGTFEKNIELITNRKIQVINSKIFFIDNRSLKCYDTEHLSMADLIPVSNECEQVLLFGDKIIQIEGDVVTIEMRVNGGQ